MSHGYSPYTTVAAVCAPDTILGPGRIWSAQDKVQIGWMDQIYRPIAPRLPEIYGIQTHATAIPARHASFMRMNGWKPTLKKCRPGQLLTAGIIDRFVKWNKAGYSVPLTAADGRTYAGAWFKEGVEYWKMDDGMAVACIATKDFDRVWLAMPASAPKPIELDAMAKALVGGTKHRVEHGCLHFPMVDLSARETLDWVTGFSTTCQDGKEWTILEAIQQINIKMSHKAGRPSLAEELLTEPTTIRVTASPMVIDRPFLVVIERQGLPYSLISAYVTENDWNDPGLI
jgi:hypothetical protein